VSGPDRDTRYLSQAETPLQQETVCVSSRESGRHVIGQLTTYIGLAIHLSLRRIVFFHTLLSHPNEGLSHAQQTSHRSFLTSRASISCLQDSNHRSAEARHRANTSVRQPSHLLRRIATLKPKRLVLAISQCNRLCDQGSGRASSSSSKRKCCNKNESRSSHSKSRHLRIMSTAHWSTWN